MNLRPLLPVAALLLLSCSAVAQVLRDEELVPDAPRQGEDPGLPAAKPEANPDVYAIVSAVRGLSLHRAMYLFPVSYTDSFEDRSDIEVLFQLSVKLKVLELFDHNVYLGYTQRSFWQLYNDSAPFRETNYSPEVFWRWKPDPRRLNHWGADVGFEHESNGQAVPNSRSWNRVYVAPFHAKGKTLAYLKFWWRVPEERKDDPAASDGDDNPNITDYYGYSELNLSRQVGNRQLLSAMARGNPRTGHGAFSVTWSLPSSDLSAFWAVTLFSGYGESLIDHEQSVTRVSLGAMLAR